VHRFSAKWNGKHHRDLRDRRIGHDALRTRDEAASAPEQTLQSARHAVPRPLRQDSDDRPAGRTVIITFEVAAQFVLGDEPCARSVVASRM
jgi:hypothetical protein